MLNKINISKYLNEHPKDVRKATVIAIIFKRSSVISYGFNRRKFHGNNRLGYKYTWHAEYAALSKAGIRARGATMLVLRIKKDGTYGNAHPCKTCESLIKKAGIAMVITT